MSNPIRYDPALVRALATELAARLTGRRCAALPVFLAGRALLLPLDGGESLRMELHPSRGHVRLVATPEAHDEPEPPGTVLGVEAPPDERRLEIGIDAGGRFSTARRRLVVELHANQWNALLVDAETHAILSVLWPREAGGRSLRAGAAYTPPPRAPRFDATAVADAEARTRWHERLGALPPAERAARMTEEFAGVSAWSARVLAPVPLAESYATWRRLVDPAAPPGPPVLLDLGGRAQPYPLPLPGVPARPVASLLAAFEAASESPAAGPAPDGAASVLLPRAERAAAAAARRVASLQAQLDAAGDAAALRLRGDLLLANLHRVPRGAASVRLADWDGAELEIELDPALAPHENADAWYDRARRRERAERRLPGLVREAEAEAARWAAAVECLRRGEPPPGWAAERLASVDGVPRDAADAPAPPYRRYRTSGGLEVRVGRSARDNDRLTFGHSAPHDVWLHARSVPGSHVILRWNDAEGAPPARDLAEAATLAALYSRARTSGLVAVDWTRRKHVRKPRGAPPGSVIPMRVKTVFVEPDAAAEERLRAEPGG